MTVDRSPIDAMAQALAERRKFARGKVLMVTDTDREDARAALCSLIDAGPTEAMLSAGWEARMKALRCDHDTECMAFYRAMLRAALEEADQ